MVQFQAELEGLRNSQPMIQLPSKGQQPQHTGEPVFLFKSKKEKKKKKVPVLKQSAEGILSYSGKGWHFVLFRSSADWMSPPPQQGKEICFTQSTDLNVNLMQTHPPRSDQSNVNLISWHPICGPVKLIHKINHHIISQFISSHMLPKNHAKYLIRSTLSSHSFFH